MRRGVECSLSVQEHSLHSRQDSGQQEFKTVEGQSPNDLNQIPTF